MLKTYLYLPEELNSEIDLLAKSQKTSKAEVIRGVLREGLSLIKMQKAGSAEALLKVAEVGDKYQPNGPKDASTNMDYYLWNKSPKKK